MAPHDVCARYVIDGSHFVRLTYQLYRAAQAICMRQCVANACLNRAVDTLVQPCRIECGDSEEADHAPQKLGEAKWAVVPLETAIDVELV